MIFWSGKTDWSERVRNLAMAAAYVASVMVVAEQLGCDFDPHRFLDAARERYRRWLRGQEFELYYRFIHRSPARDDSIDA